MKDLAGAEKEHFESMKEQEKSCKVIGNLVYAQLLSKGQQSTNEQTWTSECATQSRTRTTSPIKP